MISLRRLSGVLYLFAGSCVARTMPDRSVNHICPPYGCHFCASPIPSSFESPRNCRLAAVYWECGPGNRRRRLEGRLCRVSAPIAKKREFLDVLPADVKRKIMTAIPYEHFYRLKVVSKGIKEFIESDEFQTLRAQAVPNEGLFVAVHFTRSKGGKGQLRGYDMSSERWRMSPPVSIPLNSLVDGAEGLLCFFSVSDSRAEWSFSICNPFTQKTRVLSVSGFPWKPKVLQFISKRRIFLAGYSSIGGASSIHAAIFDSETSIWTTIRSEISRTDLRIKQFQSGAVVDATLYCIAQDRRGTRYVLQCKDMATWLEEVIPLPCDHQSSATPNCPTDEAQLAAGGGEPYLYSRHGSAYKVQHLHRGPSTAGPLWERLWREVTRYGRMESCPEHTLAPFGDDKLCLFNTKDVAGKVLDIQNQSLFDLPSLGQQVDDIPLRIQNRLNFMLRPNFMEKP